MTIYKSTRKTLWSMAAALMLVFGFQATASAGMVGTEQLLAQSQVETQRIEVGNFLQRDAVRSQLLARGVDVNSVQQRVNSLTPSELAMLHAQIDELPAGEGLLETVLFLVVIFMLLDIAGITDIFPGL